jgi:hypothetical protein
MAAYSLPQDGGFVNAHVSHLRNYVIDDDGTDDCAFGADETALSALCPNFCDFT